MLFFQKRFPKTTQGSINLKDLRDESYVLVQVFDECQMNAIDD